MTVAAHSPLSEPSHSASLLGGGEPGSIESFKKERAICLYKLNVKIDKLSIQLDAMMTATLSFL